MRSSAIIAGAAAVSFAWAATEVPADAQIIEVDYSDFPVWVDSGLRSAAMFHYVLGADQGHEDRHSGYEIDESFNRDCQALSTGTFQRHVPEGAPSYDVGHQAPANHFDGSKDDIRRTNYWTNLLPQTASMNRGAWLETEKIIECLRDETEVEVWGGATRAGTADDDHFLESHGMPTPSAFWKIAIRVDDRRAQAWLIPNGEAPGSSIDEWLVPVKMIEVVTATVSMSPTG